MLLSAYFERAAVHQAAAMLTFVYWTAVAAAAALLRVTGRRLLPDTFGSGRSHWIERRPLATDPASLSKQF